MLKQLQERFVAFRDCLPLAIGIDKQVLAAQPDLDRKTLRVALRMHVGSFALSEGDAAGDTTLRPGRQACCRSQRGASYARS